MPIDDPTKLRSYSWFNGKEYYNFSRRANVRALGISREAFHGKPVIGICNSFSELNNCNAHLRQVAEAVKRGVWAAGGFPLEFPAISLGEQYMKPTTMLFRNLMAMDVEESIRANPVDGVVLLCGCDKTTPAMLMGAASADVPAMMVTGGPTLSGNYQGKTIGQGTDGRKIFDLYRMDQVSPEELQEIEGCMVRSAGHCTVMGTASTMAIVAEALGMTLPGSAAIPAPDSRRLAMAELSGRRMVEMVREDLRPSQHPDARRRSRTRSPSTWPSAVPPTPWSICWPSPAGRRHQTGARRFRRHLAPHAVPGQRAPQRPAHDGGLLLRRRRAGRDARTAAAAAPRLPHRQRQDHRRERRATRRATTAT